MTVNQGSDGLLVLLTKHAKFIGTVTLVGTVLSAGLTLLSPNVYTADARVLIPQQTSISTLLSGQSNALAALATGGNPLKNPNDLYVGFLRSRNVVDGVIAREKLQDVFQVTEIDDARERLTGSTQVTAGKDNMVLIEVTDRDPKLATKVATAYVEELKRLTTEVGVGEAQSRRKFLETQVGGVKTALAAAEDRLRTIQETKGILDVTVDAQADVASAAAIQGRIAAKEAEVTGLRGTLADTNPQLRQAQAELAALKASAAHLRQPSLSGMAEKGQSYVRALRDVKYQEALFEGLSKQLEMATLDEAKEVSAVQVVDSPVEPHKKSGPKRTLLTLLGAMVSLLGALGVVAVRENRKG